MPYVSASATRNAMSQPVGRRAVTFVTVLTMHIGLITLLMLSRPSEKSPKKQGSFSVFALAAAAPLAPPIPITVPIIPAETKPVNPSPAEIFAELQGAKGDPDGTACSPVDVLTTGLANDPMVPAAIDRVPLEDRSISEAIVMWNAEWSSAAANDDAPLAEVRSLVQLSLANLPPDCLAMPVIGPRLIPIAEGGNTTFLAFGSGEWTWQQLIEAPEMPSDDQNLWTWEDLIDNYISPNL